ncbi:MAG: DUF421 domain-containing protein [Candidatus Fimivicinus sp.]|nr:DUF421 domain-containing protein [Oscillospiraceae bacterium]MDY5591641.1 DUF421 domain-containing protein [Candidatus Fimivicinus sp.]
MEPLKVILTALLSAVTLFILAKLMGHKQIVQLDLFDYITGITIGSIAAELATELEKPIKPLIAMIVYGLIAVCLSILTSKFPRIRKYINGTPTILMNDGKLYRKNMKKARLDLSEFLVLCRQSGYFDLSAIQTAIFEYNGQLTILPTSGQRPATPDDLSLTPPPACVFTEVIMDGRIMGENLHRKGLNEQWLQKQLELQGYRSAKEVYLGLCDQNNQLSLYV